MKKLLLSAILMFSVCVTVGAQDILNLRMDRDQLGLRGNVATIDEDLLVRKDYFREDWPTRKGFRKDLRQILQEDAGHIYTFQSNGRLASVVYTYKGAQGKKTTCSYASNGLLSSFTGEGYRVEAKYNGSNATVNIFAETPSYSTKVDLDHADLSKTPYTKVYPYDMTCRQELSTDGLVLKSSYYYVDSMPARVCTYTYSHRNQVVKERLVNYATQEDGSDVTVTSCTYDGEGCLVMKKVRGLAMDETYTYFNNAMGDCTEMTIVRPYGTVVYTYEYEYDSVGNWTMRLCYKDGVFDNAVLRTITYGKASKPAKVHVDADEDNGGDTPRLRKLTKEEKSEFAGKSEKKEKSAKTEKSGSGKVFKIKLFNKDKSSKPVKEKADKSDRKTNEKVEKPAKVKAEKSGKTEKAAKTKSGKTEKAAKTKSQKTEKPAKVKNEKAKSSKAKNEKAKVTKAKTVKAKSSKTKNEKAKSSKVKKEKAESSKAKNEKAKSSKAKNEKAKSSKAKSEKSKSSKVKNEKAESSKVKSEKAKSTKTKSEKAEKSGSSKQQNDAKVKGEKSQKTKASKSTKAPKEKSVKEQKSKQEKSKVTKSEKTQAPSATKKSREAAEKKADKKEVKETQKKEKKQARVDAETDKKVAKEEEKQLRQKSEKTVKAKTEKKVRN